MVEDLSQDVSINDGCIKLRQMENSKHSRIQSLAVVSSLEEPVLNMDESRFSCHIGVRQYTASVAKKQSTRKTLFDRYMEKSKALSNMVVTDDQDLTQNRKYTDESSHHFRPQAVKSNRLHLPQPTFQSDYQQSNCYSGHLNQSTEFEKTQVSRQAAKDRKKQFSVNFMQQPSTIDLNQSISLFPLISNSVERSRKAEPSITSAGGNFQTNKTPQMTLRKGAKMQSNISSFQRCCLR